MIYTGCESHFRWFERIVCREMYCKEKYASLIRAVGLLESHGVNIGGRERERYKTLDTWRRYVLYIDRLPGLDGGHARINAFELGEGHWQFSGSSNQQTILEHVCVCSHEHAIQPGISSHISSMCTYRTHYCCLPMENCKNEINKQNSISDLSL